MYTNKFVSFVIFFKSNKFLLKYFIIVLLIAIFLEKHIIFDRIGGIVSLELVLIDQTS